MASQQDVLEMLAAVFPYEVSLDHLNDACGARKKVIMALGRLISRRLAARVKPKSGLKHDARGRITENSTPSPMYRLTPAGFDFVRSGKRVTSGPKGPHTGPRKQKKQTFRVRIWKALRLKTRASIPDLIEIARIPSDGGNLADNARHYFGRLVRAGIVVVLPVKTKGFAPTSNGFKRFALIRDLGPLAPVATAKHLFDPNSGEKIPYREKSK